MADPAMEIILPGHDQANSILADHVEKLDIQRAQMTTDYLGDNLFDDQHPVIQWLNQSVQRAVLDYSQNLGIDYSLDFAVQAWANGIEWAIITTPQITAWLREPTTC